METPPLDPHVGDILGRFWLLASLAAKAFMAPEPTRSWLRREYAKQFFMFYNGNCPYVEGKFAFTKLVRELGYLAPASVSVPPSRRATAELLDSVRQLDPASSVRLCKPLYDSVGRGQYVARTAEEAIRFALRQGRPYLIQSFVPPRDAEWRYILHRTAHDMENESGPSVRVAVVKLGPVVVGNGRSTVKELIAVRRGWPRPDARKLAMAAPDRVPAEGERVELVNSGNISRKLHHFALPDPTELERVDVVMLEFLAAYEERIGGRLATMCVDLGIADGGLVFYELQFPFGHPYGRAYEGTGARPKARIQFAQSMYYGGIAARMR